VLTGSAALPYGTTNNEAEYCGLIYGLQAARELGVRSLIAQGDSQLVLQQLDGNFRTKSSRLEPLRRTAVSLKEGLDSVVTQHVMR